MIVFPFLFSILVFRIVSSEPDCPFQKKCNDTSLTPSFVEDYCKSYSGTMSGRCCNLNETVIGLDVRNCEITILNVTQPVFFQLEILDLRDNEYKKFTAEELVGLLKLEFLYLPQHIPCPGGPNAWEDTTDLSYTTCSGQLDICSSLNITCGKDEDAKCYHIGPGSAKCVCNPDHFGYKCLNYGVFPTAVFSTAVIVPTIGLSIALWFIQGRDPYKKLAY